MPEAHTKPGSRAAQLSPLAIAALIAGMFTMWGPIDAPLTDPFHEGEYLSTRMLFAPGMAPPLLIHGAMDYVPAALAEAVFGSSHVIAGTRLINLLCGFLASFAFIGALLSLARNWSHELAMLLIGFAILFWINARAQTIVTLQQGSPALRDLLLMVMIWVMLSYARRSSRHAAWFAGAAGAIAGLGWVWSYNRGVLMLAALFAMALGALLGRRPRHEIGWMLGGLLAGFAANLALEPQMWLQHFRNALYWTVNQSIWTAPVPLSMTLRNLPFYLLGMAVLGLGGWAALRAWMVPDSRSRLIVLLPLGLIAAGSYLSIFNRPDPPHLMFSVPALALLAVATWLTLSDPGPREEPWCAVLRRNAPLLAGIAAILVIDVSAQTGTGTARPVLQGLGRNLLTLAKGLPDDSQVAEPRAVKVAAELRADRGPCTYVFDNSGAFYHLSGLRPCSSIMLPIYAIGDAEDRLIAELERAAPRVVVGRSSYWTDRIDGRGLAERTPKLNAWYQRNYAVRTMIEGVEIGQRR